jgi:hypothetical protein
MSRLLTFTTNEYCHCGHRQSEHRLDSILLCAGETGCPCEEFEAEQMPMEKALPVLVDFAGSCQSDSVSLAIMAVLRDRERLRSALANIQSFGAQAQSKIASEAIVNEFEVMMGKEYGVQFVDVTPHDIVEIKHHGKLSKEEPNGSCV